MTVDARTIEVQPGGVVVLLRTSRLLAKAAIVLEEDGGRWAVYVATGTPKGSDFWLASIEKSVTAAQRLARGMMDGTAWPEPITGVPICAKCNRAIQTDPALRRCACAPLAPGDQAKALATNRDAQELGVPSEEE